MKHTIVIISCIVAIFALGAASAVSYNNYTKWHNKQTAKAVAASKAQTKANTLEKAIFNANLKKLQDQCAKDQAAYNALPAATKAKTPAPTCPTNLVQ